MQLSVLPALPCTEGLSGRKTESCIRSIRRHYSRTVHRPPFQFFVGKDQLVLTDIIIFYEIFFAKLGMVRQKIAFLCIGIHAAFHSCFDLSSGRCSKRGIYCTGSKKSFVIMKSGYIFILLFMCYFIYRNTYTHLLQKGSRI